MQISFSIIAILSIFFGVITIPLGIFTMYYHVMLRNFVANNCHDQIKKIYPKINIKELAGPFHSYDRYLKELNDPELDKLRNKTKRLKQYFFISFGGCAVTIVLAFLLGFLFSVFKS